MTSCLTDGEQFHQLVKKTLGKSCLRRSNELIHDIEYINQDLKPALLFDYGAVTTSDLHNFVKELSSLGYVSDNKFCVLAVGEDNLICNVPLLLDNLSKQTKGKRSAPIIVDVSRKHTEPKLIAGEKSTEIFTRIADVVSTALEEGHKGGRRNFLVLDIPLDLNVTSLFGVCLGYPVIYWYDLSDMDDRNCLNMEPLIVNHVYVTGPRTEQLKRAGSQTQQSQYQHCLYSFSYPERLIHLISDCVNNWVSSIKLLSDSDTGPHEIKISLHKEKQTLPCVAL